MELSVIDVHNIHPGNIFTSMVSNFQKPELASLILDLDNVPGLHHVSAERELVGHVNRVVVEIRLGKVDLLLARHSCLLSESTSGGCPDAPGPVNLSLQRYVSAVLAVLAIIALRDRREQLKILIARYAMVCVNRHG
jgi:hypothetical protein